MQRLRGFTLIEIAVVLGIVMVILSLGLTAISAQLSSASYAVTKKRQDAIKEALIGYFGANKSLPCPNVPMPPTPADGIAPALVAGACPNAFGTVPFTALGLAREIGEDGWGNLFSYQVYRDPAPVCPGNGRDWANSSCFGAGKIGTLTVSPIATNSVVAVVISHGNNGLGAWVAALGTRNANPVTCEEAHNAVIAGVCALTANLFYKGETQANDDVVAYLTASELLQPLVKQGAIQSSTAQVNADLQMLFEQAIAVNTATADCATSPPLLGGGGMADPWGYAYANSAPGGTPDPAFCFYTRGGNTAAGLVAGIDAGAIASAACTCVSPTICRPVSKATIGTYRNRASNSAPACP